MSARLEELEQHRVVTDVRQSVWTVRHTYTYGEHKIRATVHMDPYKFQSDFYAEVFSPVTLSWNRVHTESESWYDGIHALSSDRITVEQWETIESLMLHMVSVAQDLLS